MKLPLGMGLGMARSGAALVLNGFSLAKSKVEAGESAILLTLSDSTGNGSADPREWTYRMADALAVLYPTHSVSLYLGDATGYASPTAISIGSGSETIKIYAFAVAGSIAQLGLGGLFQNMIANIDCDCFILNHGHNQYNGLTQPLLRGELLAATEQVKLAHPGVPMIVTKQNPRRDSTGMNAVMSAIDDMALITEFSIIDVHSRFIALNKNSSLYIDDAHPNDAGQTIWTNEVMKHWAAAKPEDHSIGLSSLSALITSGQNYMVNGDFGTWVTSPGAPSSWTKGGAGTMTPAKELSIVAPGRPYSCKLLGTSGASWISQNQSAPNINALKGKKVTLAARRYLPDGAAVTTARFAISAGSPALGTQFATSRMYATEQDGWNWLVISGFEIPADCNFITCTLYHDSSASPSAIAAYWDQATLVEGSLPRRVA